MSDAPAIRHGRADLFDVRLHYATAGEGPAVLLLHGWPRTWHMRRDIIPGLAARHRVIAPDLRGLGDSSRPAGGYDKETGVSKTWGRPLTCPGLIDLADA